MNSPIQHSSAADYLKVLGLERAPFLDQVDDRFFYADPILIQRLDLLQHLTRFGDMLLGVIGPSGSGKSTLLRQFKLRGDAGWRRCFVEAAQIQRPGELLGKLAECLDQTPNAAPERLGSDLLRHLRALQQGAQRVVLVIDDAHLLPGKALSDLLQLAGDARQTLQLVRVVLFSEAGLEQKLAEAGLHLPQQPLMHSLEIPRFDESQTAAYLMYRLAVAGYSGDSPFSLTEIRALHKAADGLPGRLNVLAHETLIERANRIASRNARPASPRSGRLKWRPAAILAMATGVALLAAASWYFAQWPSLPGRSEPSVVSAIPVPIATPKDAAPPARPQPIREEQQIIKNLEPPIEKLQPTEKKENFRAYRPAADAIKEETPAVTDGAAPEQETAGPAEPTPPGASLRAEDAVPVRDDPAPAAPVLDERPEQAVEAPVMQPPTTDVDAMPTARPELAVPIQAPPADAPRQAETAPATPPAATAAEPAREPWVLARPPGHFTLQLLGVRSEASLRAYLARHRPPAPVAYFRTAYKGGEWFVLVQGDYPSMAAARAAVATLPAAVRNAQPWPRSFAAIHADIGNAEP